QIELKQGRVRKARYGSRTIDIDILFYGNQIVSDRNLTIPHPRVQERDFVVIPLSEVARESGLLPLPLTLNYNETRNFF
ncbi:MAG: 2-amino-4-hydroxy-6-hydroxymethyldihydropteridine diphosphokinase, partial [Tatlockia sp.]|nr:2-amino-4-hydroxy-6-hydroxymethyldihydropteridine diphosphokinase [Tatlockia sp.]